MAKSAMGIWAQQELVPTHLEHEAGSIVEHERHLCRPRRSAPLQLCALAAHKASLAQEEQILARPLLLVPRHILDAVGTEHRSVHLLLAVRH
jgi:hypothetical protein